MASNDQRSGLVDATLSEMIIFILFICFLSVAPVSEDVKDKPGKGGGRKREKENPGLRRPPSCVTNSEGQSAPLFDVWIWDEKRFHVEINRDSIAREAAAACLKELGPDLFGPGRDLTRRKFLQWSSELERGFRKDDNCLMRNCSVHAQFHLCTRRALLISNNINRYFTMERLGEYDMRWDQLVENGDLDLDLCKGRGLNATKE